MADGFTVDVSALQETAQGINGVIGVLGKLGISEEAEVGRGFTGLSLNGLQVGNQIAQRLGLAAGAYHDAEQTVTAAAKDVVDAAMGDPHLTDAQVAQGSWARAAGLTAAQAPNTFSGQAWKQAGQQTAATRKAEGSDVVHNGPGALERDVIVP